MKWVFSICSQYRHFRKKNPNENSNYKCSFTKLYNQIIPDENHSIIATKSTIKHQQKKYAENSPREKLSLPTSESAQGTKN